MEAALFASLLSVAWLLPLLVRPEVQPMLVEVHLALLRLLEAVATVLLFFPPLQPLHLPATGEGRMVVVRAVQASSHRVQRRLMHSRNRLLPYPLLVEAEAAPRVEVTRQRLQRLPVGALCLEVASTPLPLLAVPPTT
jgi:hypothetical protein